MTQQLHRALVYLFVCPKVLMSSALAGVSVGTEEDEGGGKKRVTSENDESAS